MPRGDWKGLGVVWVGGGGEILRNVSKFSFLPNLFKMPIKSTIAAFRAFPTKLGKTLSNVLTLPYVRIL